MLDALDGELDKLVENWTQTLLINLEDTTTKERIKRALPAKQRKIVQSFLNKRSLTEEVNHEFLDAVREALTDLALDIDQDRRSARRPARRRLTGHSGGDAEAIRGIAGTNH
jgi:hypothetical protein